MSTLTLRRIDVREVRQERPVRYRRVLYWLPLVLILVAQAVYTLRLIPIGYPSTDEARYIEAGHALIYELWHGGGSPYYETYFSGAPDFYSPLAAMADFVGGIVAVRLMSMVIMLTATILLYLTGKRLFGYASAVCAAGIFAGLGMTQVVGRNTIYDALAFMCTGAAAYCAVRARDEHGTKWLLLTPIALLVAYYAKYVTILFDPVVVGLAALGTGSLRRAGRRIFVLGSTTALVIGFSVFLAGSAYLKGMVFTVFARQHSSADVVLLAAVPATDRQILLSAWSWFGAVVLMAGIAVVLALLVRSSRQHLTVLLLCLVAGLLVTVESLHLGTMESSRRHDDLAMWFASLPAGYAASFLTRIRVRAWRQIGALLAAATVGYTWLHYGQLPSTFPQQGGYDNNATWPLPSTYSILDNYLRAPNGRYLLSGNWNIGIIYEDRVSMHWWQLVDDNYILYPIPGRGGKWHGTARGPICSRVEPHCMYLSGDAGFAAAIKAHDFDIISLTRNPSLEPQDSLITKAAETTPGYWLLTTSDGGHTWIYLPDYEHGRA